MDWRVNYTKNLDPSVTSKWKSTRRLRKRILKILGALTFLAIASTAFVLEYHPNLMTKYLGLRVNPPEEWLGTLYPIMFVLLPISFAVALIPED